MFCQENENYDLVVIESAFEQFSLEGAVPYTTWWTGMNDLAFEGDFRFIQPGGSVVGDIVEYDGFRPDQPNNQSPQDDCVMMSSSGYDDVRCQNGYRFVCESY